MKRKELDVPNFVPVPIRKITWENVYEREEDLVKKERYAKFFLTISVVVLIISIIALAALIIAWRTV